MPFVSPAAALWTSRVAWLAAAVAGASALEGRSTLLVCWWVGAAVVIAALIIPGCTSLTITRMLSPLAVPATVIVAISDPTAWSGAAAVLSVGAVALMATGEFGEAQVQASAYGDERRLPLRPPAALLPAVVVSWLVWAALLIGAIAALGAARWILAAVLGVAALGIAAPLFLRFHQLARRWLVTVPAGVVVHDPTVLGETLMVLTPNVAAVALAGADTTAADLTGPAGGYAVEITLREMALVQFTPRRRTERGRAIHAGAFLVAPSRPGRAIAAIDARVNQR